MTERKFNLVLNAIEKQRDYATDVIASGTIDLYPSMKFDASLIKSGTRINWNGRLKRAAIDLWDTIQNTPEVAPSLWDDIAYYMGYRIIPDVITSTSAFSSGEIGYWVEDGIFYKAKNDGTIWTPSVYPQAWEIIMVGDPEPSEEPIEPIVPQHPQWDSLLEGHVFNVGDYFIDGGKTYEVLRQFNKQNGWRPPALINNFYKIIN